MNNLEVNKIIAEYMGYEFSEYADGVINERYKTASGTTLRSITTFTLSLDALVPVWELLNRDHYINYNINSDTMQSWQIKIDDLNDDVIILYESDLNQSIQEATAHATALCILELSSK